MGREPLFSRYAEFVTARPLPVLAIVVALTSVFGVGVSRLRVENGIDNTVPTAHPYTQIDRRIRDDFGGTLLSLLVVQPRSGTIWRRDVLQVLYDVTQEVRLLPGAMPYTISSLASPAVRQIRNDDGGGLVVEYLMRDVPASPDEIAHLRDAVRKNPLYSGVLVSPDERAALVAVDFDRERNEAEITRLLREVVARHATADIEIQLTGQPIILETVNEYVASAGMRFALAFCLISLVLYVSFRSVQAMILPMLTAVLSSVWGMGMIGLLGITLDPYSTMTPTLVMAVAAGHSAQMLKRYYEEYARCGDNHQAIKVAIEKIAPVMAAAGCTAAAGFGSLLVFPMPSFRNFGLVAGFGILSAVVLELTFMPALRTILPVPKRTDHAASPALDIVADRVAHIISGPGRRMIFGAFGAVILLALGALHQLRYDYRLAAMLPADTAGKRDYEAIRERFGSLYTLVIAFRSTSPIASDPAMIAFVEGLQRRMERDRAIVRTRSYVDILTYANEVWNGATPSLGDERFVPHDGALATQLLWFTYSEPYQTFLSRDFRRGAVWAFFASEDVAAFRRVIESARDFTARNPPPPGVDVEIAGGVGPLIVALTDTIITGKILNIAIVVAAVFLVATVVLRSLTGAALVILPLLVTVLIEFGLMAGFGVSLNPSTATISAMSVGIGADYAIYLLYRFREEYQQRRFVEPALAETLRTSGRAVLFVALAIGGGYGTLALSGFEPFRVTGIFVMLTMTVSCLSALLLMMSCMVALRPRFVFAGSGAV